MVSKGDTLGQGDTMSLVQGQGGVLLFQLKAASGVTSGTGFQIVDGSGNVNSTFDFNGGIAPKSITGTGVAGAASGSLPGLKAPVISGQGATRTLLATESGSSCYFDRAAGIVYTLPAPAVGLYFDFLTTVTVTSNAYTVVTDTGTTLLLGFVNMGISGAATSLYATPNGSTHVRIASNGSTTGGIIGSQYRMTCVDSTHWLITGLISATATMATPFST